MSAKATLDLLDQVKAAVKADATEALPKTVFIVLDYAGVVEGAYESPHAAMGAASRISTRYPIVEVTLHPSLERQGI